MKRSPEDILAEAVWRARAIFDSPIQVETEGNRLLFVIQWAGSVEESQRLLDEFDRWWLFYVADVSSGFHVEFVNPPPAAGIPEEADAGVAARKAEESSSGGRK